MFVNSFLHIFGWAIILEMEKGEVWRAYPARVKFRGFNEESVSKAYQKLSTFMLENAEVLNEEACD